MKLKVLLTAILLCSTQQIDCAEALRSLKPTDVAPAVQLNDYRGAAWSWSDLKDKPVVVVAFLGTECPLVKLYAERLQQLANQYAAKNVAFIGINSNQQDSLAEIGHFVKEHGLTFTMLKDAGNAVADQFGAERTPEVFVLDGNRKVHYHGRIDDQYTYGVQKQKAEQRFLADAIDAVLAGKRVAVTQTEVVGCHIGRVLSPQGDSEVTYSKHISRILNERCVSCHRPGEIGPFSLRNYSETVGWAEMIAEVVQQHRMPPWHASPEHGKFSNDARLSDAEQTQIKQWVEAGAPEGDPRDLPPEPQFVEGWRIGKPDLIVHMSEEPFQVPATGEVRYQYFMVDTGFKEDKWVKAAECRPGNRAVVHHIIVAAGNRGRSGEDLASEWLTATAPGARPLILPPGLAKRIPAGSKLIFQMHYTPNGKAQEDRSSVGLIFSDPAEVKQEVKTQKAANPRFRIPPGDSNYKVEADYRFEEDSVMLAAFPHMHLRGKSFLYTAHYPDGREETLLDVPHYDFNWQNSYVFSEPKRMPAGTRIHCVAHFDNSKENWANPDPTATVKWGDQTWEEMMIGYFDMTPIRPVTLKTSKVEDRVAKFMALAAAGPVKVPEKVQAAAKGATASTDSWQQLGSAVRELAPQVDRVDWMSVADNKLTIERVAQNILGRRSGGEGMAFPSDQLLVAKYAMGKEVVVHSDISKLSSADYRLLSRLFSSSMHVPVTLNGKPGVVSFWSSDKDAFPPAAVEVLQQVATAIKD